MKMHLYVGHCITPPDKCAPNKPQTQQSEMFIYNNTLQETSCIHNKQETIV